jgi:tetratricopeptide (TPR) repeat protein
MQIAGSAYLALGQAEKAKEQFDEFLRVGKAVLGNDHVWTIWVTADAGRARFSLGELPEAERFLREALEACRRSANDDPSYELQVLNDLGMLTTTLGRFDEGEALYRQAIQGIENQQGPHHRLTLLYQVGLANNLMRRPSPRLEEARAILESVVEPMSQTLGGTDGYTLRALARLAQVHIQSQQPGKALVVLDDVCARVEAPGVPAGDAASAHAVRGAVLMQLNQPDRAADAFERAVARTRGVEAVPAPVRAGYLNELARAMEASGRADAAQAVRRELAALMPASSSASAPASGPAR